MLQPLEKQGGKKRLRSSAANYLVAEMVNRIKRAIPHINYMPSGDRVLFEIARKQPGEAGELLSFVQRIHARMGEPDPMVERAMKKKHNARLREMARSGSLLRAVNGTRSDLGLSKLSHRQLLRLLKRFDRIAASPHLWSVPPEGNKLQQAFGMLRPRELKRWLFPADESTLHDGQAFALTHLANIVVTGHTHSASHTTLSRGRHTNHLLDPGTWTPVAEDGQKVNPHGLLTYVDIRQLPKTPTVRLRRWDATKNRAVTLESTHLSDGQFLSEAQVR